jgi:ribosomal protein S12 methylthiotransferase accessory factor
MKPADCLLVGFKRHLRVETVPAEAVYLMSERGVTALSGSSIERLAPLLDGTRAVEQVLRELSPELAAAEVEGVLARLSEASLLDFRRPPVPGTAVTDDDGAAAAYWNYAGLDADSAASALGVATVEIVAVGRTDAAAAAAMCGASGLAWRDAGAESAAVSLVLCEDYLDPRLEAVNARQLACGRPWLLAKPSGADVWIGPLFQPGAGPCWACLARRLEGNRDGTYLMRRVLGAGEYAAMPPTALPASRGAALQLAVLQLVKWLAGAREEEQQAINVLDTLTLRSRHHAVPRRPQCAACGDPGMVAAQVAMAPVLVPRAIADPVGNGQRAMGPEQVLARYGHLIDPVTGIVAELRRDPRAPDFLHSYLSGRNRAMTTSTVAGIKAGLRYHSGGKGATELEARAGALCEAIERYCATRQGDEPTVRGSFLGLGAEAVHPATCLLFDRRQFADRTRWNAVCAPFHRVPQPFDESEVMDWTPAWSLLTGERRLLPADMLYFNPDGAPPQAAVLADSNGNAAGSSVEDAILHGFLELVERDAVALWWYNRTSQPAVCLGSFEDAWIDRLSGSYRTLGREVWVLDVTSDLGIPVMAAISRRTDKAAEDIMFGFGAHFDPRIAARRALTELGQLLPAVAGVQADGSGYGLEDPHLVSWWTRATVGNQPYLSPGAGQPVRIAADYGYIPRGYLDLDGVCTAARGAGLDILVLDQTRPDIKMPVVKVVVPGLRHFWPRFAPGRLFDVPVSLGRLTRPTNYSDLNPIPLYV